MLALLLLRSEALWGSDLGVRTPPLPPAAIATAARHCCSTFTMWAVPALLCLGTATAWAPGNESDRGGCQRAAPTGAHSSPWTLRRSSSSRLLVEGARARGVSPRAPVLGLALRELPELRFSELESGCRDWAERVEWVECVEWACKLLRWYTGFWKESGCRLRCWLREGWMGLRTCGALWGRLSRCCRALGWGAIGCACVCGGGWWWWWW